MQPHIEIESTRSLLLEGTHRFWGWEIPIYLFLGGLVAGLMLTVSAAILLRGTERITPAMRMGLLAAPGLLSLGMLALFIDLTLKFHVFRFYMAFRPYAPMSLGSWILMAVYPVQMLLVLAFPCKFLEPYLGRLKHLPALQSWIQKRVNSLAYAGLAGGIGLGVYTGVLLSATVANPLWSSGALGFLFLVSGSSTGVALLMLAERDHDTHTWLARIDVGLIALEILVIGSWIVGLATQGPLYREAVGLILHGPYAPAFLGFVVFGGLIVPGLLEIFALQGRAAHSRTVPTLVLIGGLILRFVIVYAGQEVSFYQA